MVKDAIVVFTEDMKDLITLFIKNNVKYVLVGGFAVNYYGYVRTTQDIDILLYPSKENAQKIMKSLNEFGFGKAGIPQEYFETEGTAIHLGAEPNRIDLLTHLKAISNDHIFTNMNQVEYEGIEINIISFKDLLDCKKNSNRQRDLADAEELEKTNTQKKKDET